MWKWFLLFWFAPWRTLLSQPVTSENVRESRQLNFDECCPCDNIERSTKYHDVLHTQMEEAATIDSCPCLSAPDSESASSIFAPALRTVEPFYRSGKEKNPKPLLNPEVGLASSVLETLREVTDQEYQEALVRDAARNAFKDMEQNLLEQETVNIPRNIVNIILQPKDEDKYDVMPEASHIQETRCIHPPLGKPNSYNQKKIKPSKKLLREYVPLSTTRSSKNYFDMTNSASNMQEHVIPPSKTNILEDLKLKSDLLKMKLFSSTKNSLKGADTDFNTPNQFNKQVDYDNSNNNHALRIPNFKLSSILDFLKTSKQKNPSLPSPIMEETDKNQENDFMFSPSNLEKYYIRNNGKGYYTPNDVKSSNTEEEPKSKQISYSKEMSMNNNFFGKENHVTSDQSNPKLIPLTEVKLNSDNDLIAEDNFFEKNNFDVNVDNINDLKNEVNSNNNDVMDAVLSPSELNVVEKPADEINESENGLKKECEIGDISTYVNKNVNNDIQKETLMEETAPKIFDETINKDNNEIITKSVEVNGLDNKEVVEKICDVEDLETESSSDNLQKSYIEQGINKNTHFDIDNEPSVRDNQLLNVENTLSSKDKGIVNNELYKINTLPNFQPKIFKTLDNFKEATEKIQEKLIPNIQNSLNNMIKNNYLGIESTTLTIPTNDGIEKEYKMGDDLTTQDLQEMSDRILNCSLSNNKDQLTLDSKVITNENIDIIKKTDNIPTSKVNNNVISTMSLFQMTEPTSTLSDSIFRNFDETVNVVDEIIDKKPDNDNNDIGYALSTKNPCASMAPQQSDQFETGWPNDQETEMMSEASDPIINSIPRTNKNFMIQANPDIKVMELLDNFRSSISDILKNNRDTNTKNEENGNSNRNSILLKKDQKSNFNEQPFSESRNIDIIKSYSNTPAGSNLFKLNKNNHQVKNLNSYKAKVASPETLNLRTIPSLTNEKEGILQKSVKNDYEIMSPSSIWHSPIEVPNFSRLKNFRKNTQNDIDPGFNLMKPHLNLFSENLKSRTEEALRNIQESLDDLQKSQIRNQKNILGKTPTKPNIFQTLQPNNLSKKFEDINSNVMNTLSLMSQRLKSNSILPAHEVPSLQAKNKINNLYNRDKSNPKLILKTNKQSKQNSQLKPNAMLPLISSSKKSGISKPYLQQKSNLSSHPISANLRNIEYSPKLKNGFETKTVPKKDIKRKPLKENKVSFSFSPTSNRPEIIKLNSNAKILNKPTPPSFRSPISLPKSSTSLKSPLQKRLELMSKLKPGEMKPLGSERFTSRIALPDKKIDNYKSKTFLPLEESMTPPESDVSDETIKMKSSGFSSENDPVGRASENVVLSKIRDAVKAKTSNGNMNKKFLDSSINNIKSNGMMSDAAQSASDTINTALSSVTEKPLKENVSYKCKMICFEDN